MNNKQRKILRLVLSVIFGVGGVSYFVHGDILLGLLFFVIMLVMLYTLWKIRGD